MIIFTTSFLTMCEAGILTTPSPTPPAREPTWKSLLWPEASRLLASSPCPCHAVRVILSLLCVITQHLQTQYARNYKCRFYSYSTVYQELQTCFTTTQHRNPGITNRHFTATQHSIPETTKRHFTNAQHSIPRITNKHFTIIQHTIQGITNRHFTTTRHSVPGITTHSILV